MGVTRFTGPVMSGDLLQGDTNGPNTGLARLSQTILIQQAGAGTQNYVLNIPAGSVIEDFNVDVLTAFDSVTSATLTIGNAVGGTQYVSSQNVKTAGRAAITYTAAQLAAMAGLTVAGAAAPTVANINMQVVATGTTANGTVLVTVHYVQQGTLT